MLRTPSETFHELPSLGCPAKPAPFNHPVTFTCTAPGCRIAGLTLSRPETVIAWGKDCPVTATTTGAGPDAVVQPCKLPSLKSVEIGKMASIGFPRWCFYLLMFAAPARTPSS